MYTLEKQPLLKMIKHVPIISKKLTIKKAIGEMWDHAPKSSFPPVIFFK